MRKIITVLILVAIFLMTAVKANGAMSVTDLTLAEGETATGLANTIVGPGVTVSNITYSGHAMSSGSYTGGSVINIPTGVILTSGNANFAESATNTSDSKTFSSGSGGDADLQLLIPGYSVNDATILEFDFSLDSGLDGDIYFNYAFASDEYNEWVYSSYNDVFGLFLDGVNISQVPLTVLPVTIDNVNNFVNSAYYNSNDPSDGQPTPYGFEYDGFTDVFTASAAIAAGTHHMKFGIADAGDTAYDSAVFIQGSSFSDEPTPIIPVPGAFLLGMLGLSVAGVKLRKHA